MERVIDALKQPLSGQQISRLVDDILHTDAIYLSTLPKRISGGPDFLFARKRRLRACVGFVRRVLKHHGMRLMSTRRSVRHENRISTEFTYWGI